MNLLRKLLLSLSMLCLCTYATAAELELEPITKSLEIKYIDPQGTNGISQVKVVCKIDKAELKDCPVSVMQYLALFMGKNPDTASLSPDSGAGNPENPAPETMDKNTSYHAFLQFKFFGDIAEPCQIEKGLNEHRKPTHFIIHFPEEEDMFCELKHMEGN